MSWTNPSPLETLYYCGVSIGGKKKVIAAFTGNRIQYMTAQKQDDTYVVPLSQIYDWTFDDQDTCDEAATSTGCNTMIPHAPNGVDEEDILMLQPGGYCQWDPATQTGHGAFVLLGTNGQPLWVLDSPDSIKSFNPQEEVW